MLSYDKSVITTPFPGQGRYSACPPSIAWTAPEVLRHANSQETEEFITKSSDVYSFGIVMWELVMCEDPFEEMSTLQEVEYLRFYLGFGESDHSFSGSWEKWQKIFLRDVGSKQLIELGI